MMNRKLILIVEDEPIVAEVCTRVMEADGFGVEVAANGRSGKTSLDAKNYDVILIDLRMPVLDGRQLLEYIKKSRPDMLDRVIMTSGELISEDAVGFIASCGRPFLRKPFSPRQLKALVTQVLDNTNRLLP